MSKKIKTIFEKMEEKFSDLKILCLTTVDGFPVCTHVTGNAKISEEQEKISAVASSLAALSNAASRQLINSELVGTTIETHDGNMFLIHTEFDEKKCVLCVVTGNKQNIGHARYFTNQMAKFIKKQ